MSAQPAFATYPERSPERSPRERIRVVPGRRGTSSDTGTTPQRVLLSIVVVLGVLTLVALANLFLSAATVKTSMQTQAISTQISEARAEGTTLEVTQSLLSNPTRVRQQAEKLGMSAPAEVGNIVMSQDIVSTDESGALSLSRSVDLAAASAE